MADCVDEFVGRWIFLAEERKRYCMNCDKRKGMKKGKMRFLYDIGEAPCRSCGIGDVLDDFEDIPAADVAPVRHGRWKFKQDKAWVGNGNYMCSECRYGFASGAYHEVNEFKFCPMCGAKMDGGET